MSTIALFEQKQVRRAWNQAEEKWYFAIVDVVAVLTDSNNPPVYWRVMKKRLTDEGSETVTKCNALKMTAADGKQRLTDVADRTKRSGCGGWPAIFSRAACSSGGPTFPASPPARRGRRTPPMRGCASGLQQPCRNSNSPMALPQRSGAILERGDEYYVLCNELFAKRTEGDQQYLSRFFNQ